MSLGWEGEAVTCVAAFQQGSRGKLTEFLPGKGRGKVHHCNKRMEILQKPRWQFRYGGQLYQPQWIAAVPRKLRGTAGKSQSSRRWWKRFGEQRETNGDGSQTLMQHSLERTRHNPSQQSRPRDKTKTLLWQREHVFTSTERFPQHLC